MRNISRQTLSYMLTLFWGFIAEHICEKTKIIQQVNKDEMPIHSTTDKVSSSQSPLMFTTLNFDAFKYIHQSSNKSCHR